MKTLKAMAATLTIAASAMSATVLVTACDGQNISVGNAPDAGSSNSPAPDGGATTSGVWSGYVENFKFPSGSDHVTLTFTTPTTGTVILGDPPAPPPATDPHVGYPPGVTIDRRFQPPVVEGFAFTMFDGVVQGARHTFGILETEAWKSWCELQTPQLEPSDNSWHCGPNSYAQGSYGCEGAGADGGWIPGDCNKFALCAMLVCQCTETNCTFGQDDPRLKVTFDLAFDAQTATGSSPFGFLRLTKQ